MGAGTHPVVGDRRCRCRLLGCRGHGKALRHLEGRSAVHADAPSRSFILSPTCFRYGGVVQGVIAMSRDTHSPFPRRGTQVAEPAPRICHVPSIRPSGVGHAREAFHG
ncbi:Putative uncharacterized protein [Pseudomonas aeruginosa]|uniref:Uncharacterized protein n=1 Tax=Pseudomonas aeruginosa TaxID=287 RepID=Q9R3B4_PSEAI|nr:hypothetical protein [Pseudomonas aeruginosa]BAA83147.1 hypothetical protein [Pseudomonas aeruginosa PAO1]CEI78612.1 Putative uncharacterized protein [Pseudomonas aeruginosa]